MFAQEPDPDSLLGRLALRARRVPWPIRLVILLPAFVLPVYFLLTDSGPYAFFADLQGDSHAPLLSFLLTLIVFLVPAGALQHLIVGLFPKPVDTTAAQQAAYFHQQYHPTQQGPFPQQGPYPQQGPSPQAPPPSPPWPGSQGRT